MTGYLYVKKESPTEKTTTKKKYFGYIFLSLGAFLFASVVLPILRFQIEYSLKFNRIVNPLSVAFYNRSGHILGQVDSDYTQLSNWFQDSPDSLPQASVSPSTKDYTLSIPKLKIKDAIVKIGSMDLKQSLIQYPQTALPGQLGNTVVFGHSVLPQFFSPTSYVSIFSTVYKLEQGDEIFVNFDNIHYKYLIEEMFEVQPTDLSVLEQRFDSRYLTLITCSPPGTYLRRLIIKTRLADF